MKKQSLERTPRSLNAITEHANQEYRLAVKSAGEAVEHAYQCGLCLLEAKEQVPHGDWADWLKRNFEASHSTAKNYMKVARDHPKGLPNSQTSGDLSISKLLEANKKPKADTPEPPTPPQTPVKPPQGDEPDDDWLPDGATENGSGEADNVANEALGEGHTVVEAVVVPDPLIEAQKGLDELAEKIDEAITLARKVFKVQGREITQPFLKHFTWTGVIGNLMDYEHSLEDNRPVGGTPAKPETVRTQKAREALGK